MPLPPALPPVPAMVLADAELRGVSYHIGPDIIDQIRPATRLVLRRDAGNGHDLHAVSIHLVTGERIGYVPREQNRAIAALLDAGHELRGDVTELDRIEFQTRLSGDGKPFPGRVILETLGEDEDGAQRVRMAEIRPRFRAWLVTGLPPDCMPPDPLDVPGWPGWKKLMPEFEPQALFGQALLHNAPQIQPGVELAVENRSGEESNCFWLRLPNGEHIGSLLGAEADALLRGIEAGLETRVVITRVRRNDEAPDGFGQPWLELRCKGDVPPLPTSEQRETRRREREEARSARFQRDMDQFFARVTEDEARHVAITASIEKARKKASRNQTPNRLSVARRISTPDSDRAETCRLKRLSAYALNRLGDCTGLGSLSYDAADVTKPLRPDMISVRDATGRGVTVLMPPDGIEILDLETVFSMCAEAGTDWAVVIWVCPSFNLKHLGLIRWLNRHMAEGFAFFAVEATEFVDCDNPALPQFSLVAGP